nr:uncharacterized protein LOC129435045 isoform X2 [Misgurnus anguillicaudatus]XP_055049528.1 uncharacterized protein LOC129435045 isoform X2 [Misgurnus anguillicaudatus]
MRICLMLSHQQMFNCQKAKPVKIYKVPKNLDANGFKDHLRIIFPQLKTQNFDLCKVNRHRVVTPVENFTPKATRSGEVMGRSAVYIRPEHDIHSDSDSDSSQVVDLDPEYDTSHEIDTSAREDTEDDTSHVTDTSAREDTEDDTSHVTDTSAREDTTEDDTSHVTDTSAREDTTEDDTSDVADTRNTEENMDTMVNSVGESGVVTQSTRQHQMESLQQRRNLIMEQDAAFQRSLETDRQKTQREREAHRIAKCIEEAEKRRVDIVNQRMAEAEMASETGGTSFQFRYSDGSYRRRDFHLDSPMQSLISFAGAVPSATEDFNLTAPSLFLQLHSQQTGTIRENGLFESTTIFIHWINGGQVS